MQTLRTIATLLTLLLVLQVACAGSGVLKEDPQVVVDAFLVARDVADVETASALVRQVTWNMFRSRVSNDSLLVGNALAAGSQRRQRGQSGHRRHSQFGAP